MTNINIGSTLQYDVRQTTIFLFKIAAGWTAHQRVLNEQLSFDPLLDVENCQVGVEGNRLHRVVVEPCQLSVNYQATVELTPDIERPSNVGESRPADMPAEVLTYMNPSRYCESDLLGRFAFEEFGNHPKGFSRVQAICDWVYNQLDYTPGSTNATTTAADVLLQRTGVCRDYAHLAITLCRGVGIPARYVSGYAVNLQPPDYHGFVEAFLDGQWYLFDPTRLASTTGLVRVGVGRDAADVAFSTLTGSAVLTQKNVWANFADSQPNVAHPSAVSIS
ncbi:MAG: transglutaminase family protein [Rhodopirellula sp. JB044]|uniref:transglutaminase-like domain-containing protein n=1 Tax=Rhodopirellula sp. JB044 TaxID=3342844 RepID=UPI00370ACD33